MSKCIGLLSIVVAAIVLPVQSQSISVEFIDTTANKKTGEIGYRGTAESGYLFLGTPNAPEVKVESGNMTVPGTITGSKFMKGSAEFDSVRAAAVADYSKSIPDGSVTNAKLSPLLKIPGAAIDSISWSKITGVPEGFADGVDNTGTGGSASDSTRAASIADSCRKIPDGSVTSDKMADGAVTDAKISGVDWSKVTGKPAGYRTHSDSISWPAGTSGQVWKMGASGPAWGTDLQGSGGATTIAGITGLSDTLSAHRTLINAKANSSDLPGKANVADVYAKTLTYSKTEVDTKLSGKADGVDVYTKPEVDTRLAAKASTTALDAKADASSVYGKAEVDAKVAGVAGGVDYAENNTGYYPVSSANTSIISMSITCPNDGYLIVTGTCTVYGNDDATGDQMGMNGGVTLDATELSSSSFVTAQSNSNLAFPLSHTKGFSVSKGNHTVRFIFSPSLTGTYRVYFPSLTCFFSQNRL